MTIEALGLVEEGEELFGNLATSLTPEFDADLPLTLQDGECLPLEVSGGPTWKQGSPCPRRDRAVLVMQVEGVDGPNVRTAAWDVFPGVGTPCSTTFDVDGEPGFAPWSPVPLDYWGGIFGNGPDDIDIRYRPTFRPDRLVVTVAGPPGTEPVVEQKWGWDRFNLTIETEGVYWVTFEPTFEHGGCPRCQTTALILDVQY